MRLQGESPKTGVSAITEPWRRGGEMNHRHPVCRERVQGVLDACAVLKENA
ncbi:MAG: hypothetical protein R6U13_10090 [Desulfatiglandaceae bacterium]